jgi:hypothetical protein
MLSNLRQERRANFRKPALSIDPEGSADSSPDDPFKEAT